jgi:hypothetical protein
MKAWQQRPIEIRNLFNPAFCGMVLQRALSGFAEEDDRGMPFSLSLLVLPLCLEKRSRETLPTSVRSHLLKVVADHPEMLVGFPRRAQDLLPFTFEGLAVLMQVGSFEVSEEGRFQPLPSAVQRAEFGNEETRACQRAARYVGRQFARIGDRATIYTTFGVRP